ncbi:hypothetical protein L873DRAFT_1674372 [Choiromyces venosus 120613-1]|uniref:RING-type E3 ubiquitin transferase n=1 Tax=Choiromyces venosus 120613-1 TaxID=1336337 RepID=A0A3N4JUP7_9PEZI|nr:hypothetical protein L873DRAFT_1674372 [Choiromyces venosus 120613-1]
MASGSGPQVDIMNDPAYNASSSASGSNDNNGEPDHCRICRSEGSREEPLFYPCKCSGSIKFVHQDCLLEWLQHSQKKHCELCKTPFHFTKLYDPQMPTTIPTPLFLRRLLGHLFKNFLLWARALLVGCVWLGGLPYCVRWMWRMWFWLSDGGWWTDQTNNGTTTTLATTTPLTNLPGTPTVASAVINSTTSAFGSGIIGFLRSPLFSGPVMSPVNGDKAATNITTAVNTTVSNTAISIGARLGGLFLDPNPFHNFTRYPALNGVIVDIFEGQLLTALIVISFILVFLIREWVVQQQPALGGAVAFPRLDELQGPQPDNFHLPEINPPPQDHLVRERELAPARALEQLDEPGPARREPVPPRVFANPRGRRLFPEGAPAANPGADSVQVRLGNFNVNANTDTHNMQKYGQGYLLGGRGSESATTRPADWGESSDQPTRRPQVNRKAMSQPTEIRRAMEERSEASDRNSRAPNTTAPNATNAYEFKFSFAGRDQTPSPVYSPESGGSSGSRTPARFGRASSPVGYKRDIIDMGAPLGRERSLYNFSGNSSPETAAIGESSSSSSTGGQINKGKQPESVFQAYEGLMDNEDQWEDEEEEDDMIDSKGKGIKKSSSHVDSSLYYQPPAAGTFEFVAPTYYNFTSKTTRVRAPTPAAARYSSPPISQPSTPTSDSLPHHSSVTIHAPVSVRPGADIPWDRIVAEGTSNTDDQIAEHEPQEIGIAGSLQRQNLEAEAIQGSPAPIQEPTPDQPPQPPFDLWNRAPDDEDIAREVAQAMAEDDTGTEGDVDDGTDAEDNAENEVAGAPANEVPQDLQQAIADEDAADDFDGIMELIGMRGPLVGLLQNAAISIVLITTTVALGVAFPYVMGKIVMIILANPVFFFIKVPTTVVSFVAEFAVESSTCLLFSLLLIVEEFVRFLFRPIERVVPMFSGASSSLFLSDILKRLALDGKDRVTQKMVNLESIYMDLRTFPSAGAPPVSALTRQGWVKASLGVTWAIEKLGFGTNQTYSLSFLQDKGVNISTPIAFFNSSFTKVIAALSRTPQNTTNATAQVASLGGLPSLDPVYIWTVWDRVTAVFLGYTLFTILGMLYLQNARKKNLAVNGRVLEKIAVELLSQAGGVMKVVLIIGIEMLAFPLYCGLLLDFALLPLFEEATILSRIQFFADFPLTSVFVHWFVGTCYMFHFALFVSMCRKIMRSGVLYFIRDPDDPNFHPVKDVLDRPVMMQLRKIGFSALIYGVLVIVCLGGVVWSLYLATESVLPIHWSSNEPVLEFPVDLLFYNFFMPIAVQFFKPSDGLQKMYAWWFRKCARFLRLTSFMFGDRTVDEEGRHIRQGWAARLLRKKGDVNHPIIEANYLKEAREANVDAYFQRDGRYVRAPASDSVRRPKGRRVFIPVTENNVRLDEQDDPIDSATGPNSPDFKLVYLPPWFKTRIGLLVLAIWGFAAFTGIGVTIGPLLLGRAVLKQLVPPNIKLNDIYAFSVGIYIIGAFVYAGAKWKLARKLIKRGIRTARESESLWRAMSKWLVRVAKISYVLTAFGIVLPTLLALMIEFYVIIPIHTYFSNDDQHVIHFIQDWTLGVLYIKMMGRMLLVNTESAWARSLRGVVARGYLDPDVKLATKHFIAPAGGFMLVALLLPLGLGSIAANTFLKNAPAEKISQIYRYSYPAVFAIFFFFGLGYLWKILVDSWKQSIIDEVYLTGEQLHNHGEDAPPTTAVETPTTTTDTTAVAVVNV